MPSIPSRPLELLSPFAPLANRNHSECNDFGKSRHSDSSIQSDSDDSEKSTLTNSPLSCYNPIKFSSNPAKTPEDDALSTTQHSEHVAPSNSTKGPLDTCDPDIDESSLSSSDDMSLEPESDCDLDSVGATKPQQESLDKQMKKEGPKKKSVGFERLSTLYVFEDNGSGQDEEGLYDINNAWYSINELKAFRADAFLTVNWLVMKSINPKNRKLLEELQLQNSCSSFRSQGRGGNETNNYYSNKFGYDRQKEIQIIAEESNYEFCKRGVECRTPMGRYKKNKRRMDAMRVVMLYQQMQKQHRRELKRQERRQQQRQYHSSFPRRTIQRHTSDPEALRRIEADVDTNALSNIYSAYCKDSAAEALARGQTDAIAVGMPTTNETREEQITTIDQKPKEVDCPSITNEEDEFMDRLISLSFCSDDNEAEQEEESTTSYVSEGSLLLEDLAQHDEDPQEVSGVVEVELVEGNEENPHRIYCSEVAPTVSNNKKAQNKSWSHPDWTTTFSCNSLPSAAAQQKLVSPPTSASFSSLEMGGLVFDAVTRFDWW